MMTFEDFVELATRAAFEHNSAQSWEEATPAHRDVYRKMVRVTLESVWLLREIDVVELLADVYQGIDVDTTWDEVSKDLRGYAEKCRKAYEETLPQ